MSILLSSRMCIFAMFTDPRCTLAFPQYYIAYEVYVCRHVIVTRLFLCKVFVHSSDTSVGLVGVLLFIVGEEFTSSFQCDLEWSTFLVTCIVSKWMFNWLCSKGKVMFGFLLAKSVYIQFKRNIFKIICYNWLLHDLLLQNICRQMLHTDYDRLLRISMLRITKYKNLKTETPEISYSVSSIYTEYI